jgi:hypothetical protein
VTIEKLPQARDIFEKIKERALFVHFVAAACAVFASVDT